MRQDLWSWILCAAALVLASCGVEGGAGVIHDTSADDAVEVADGTATADSTSADSAPADTAEVEGDSDDSDATESGDGGGGDAGHEHDSDADGTADSDASLPCGAGDGPCCDDGTMTLLPRGAECEAAAQEEFECAGESTCGAVVRRRTRSLVCSGTSAACDGGFGAWTAFETVTTCAASERCSGGLGECVTGTPECDPRNPDYCLGRADYVACDDGVQSPIQDVCVAGDCVTPGCSSRSCSPTGPSFEVVPGAPRLELADPADNGDTVVIDQDTGLWWQQSISAPQGTWDAAKSACNTLTYAGQSDWRLVDCYEVTTLADYEKADPVINTLIFSFHTQSWVWTSCWERQDAAWAFNPARGDVNAYPTSFSFHVWCVRGGRTTTYGPPAPRFEIDPANEGVVLDHALRLKWQLDVDGTLRSWAQAVTYCTNLTIGDESGWRAPHVDELTSLVDYHTPDARGRRMDVIFGYPPAEWFWSATPMWNPPSHGSAWPVNFADGAREPKNKDIPLRVRCVADL